MCAIDVAPAMPNRPLLIGKKFSMSGKNIQVLIAIRYDLVQRTEIGWTVVRHPWIECSTKTLLALWNRGVCPYPYRLDEDGNEVLIDRMWLLPQAEEVYDRVEHVWETISRDGRTLEQAFLQVRKPSRDDIVSFNELWRATVKALRKAR